MYSSQRLHLVVTPQIYKPPPDFRRICAARLRLRGFLEAVASTGFSTGSAFSVRMIWMCAGFDLYAAQSWHQTDTDTDMYW